MTTLDVVRIDDPADERLADYNSLTDVVLRSKHEPAKGLYIAESSTVIRRALAAGHRPRSFLMAPKWLDSMSDLIGETGAPVYVAEEPLLKEITGFNLHRGAMAAMHRPPLPGVHEVLAGARGGAGARRVVIFEDIVDHTNVGAGMRACAALGVDVVLFTPSCADPLYRRAVRVSMGTVFQIPWTRIDPWPGGIQTLHEHGFKVAALALEDDSISLDDLVADPPEKLALVLGTEGDGLKARTIAECDMTVRIPMSGGVDSLNVASAVAVAAWATRVPHADS
jgi:tRNA G18 (ribose-2'-O)-methylase SpoU